MNDEAAQAYTIRYPSGVVVKLFGILVGPLKFDKDNIAVFIKVKESAIIGREIIPAGSGYFADPRCIISDENKTIVYTPRRNASQQPGWVKKWLKENPKWAR